MQGLRFDKSPVVVFDLEYTAWEGSQRHNWSRPGENREIVQIGAVSLEPDTLAEKKSFERLVLPLLRPDLSDYFIELTGITQTELDNRGTSFEVALHDFIAFLEGATHVLCNGGDEQVLMENCRLRRMEPPPETIDFRNIRPLLAALLDRPAATVNSGDLWDMLGERNGEKPHDALSDARAVAAALRQFRKAGQV